MMDKALTFTDLPVYDKAAGLRLAGDNQALADEIFDLFLAELQTDLPDFHALNLSKNYPELLRRVHKLHGACCYTGTPRLKALLNQLETDLKTHIMDNVASLLDQLDTEVHLLLLHHARLM